ncbi:MAG: arginine deiminase family protein [Burkholderiaceae bacterium]
MKDNVAGLELRRSEAPRSLGHGVYSEVGKLRSVLVCRPGLAHERLSPRICRELKFAAPLWVQRAQREFSEFVDALRQRGVEVLELHALLAQTLAQPGASNWLLERLLDPLSVPDVLGVELRAACASLEAKQLAEFMIGGATLADLGLPTTGVMGLGLALHPFVLPPLPHALFMRDSHNWVQSGVSLNQVGRHGPRIEASLVGAIYRFHPRFEPARPHTWWGEAGVAAPRACAAGGDIMALGKSVVLIGVGAGTQARAAVEIARGLFEGGAAHTVIAAQMPQPAGESLGCVFTYCAPDVVTYRPDVVDRITCQEWRPAAQSGGIAVNPRAGMHLLDVLSEALHIPTLNAIATGTDSHEDTTQPWDDGNGALALAPGVAIAFERNVQSNQRLRQAGIEVIEVPGTELSRVGARAHGLVCPLVRDAVA